MISYVEMLEEQQRLLITGLRKLYSHLSDAQAWPYPLPERSNGKPVLHDILESVGVLPETPVEPAQHDQLKVPPRLKTDLSTDDVTSTSTQLTPVSVQNPSDFLVRTEIPCGTSDRAFSSSSLCSNMTVPSHGEDASVIPAEQPASLASPLLSSFMAVEQPAFGMVCSSTQSLGAMSVDSSIDDLLDNIAWSAPSSFFGNLGRVDFPRQDALAAPASYLSG